MSQWWIAADVIMVINVILHITSYFSAYFDIKNTIPLEPKCLQNNNSLTQINYSSNRIMDQYFYFTFTHPFITNHFTIREYTLEYDCAELRTKPKQIQFIVVSVIEKWFFFCF